MTQKRALPVKYLGSSNILLNYDYFAMRFMGSENEWKASEDSSVNDPYVIAARNGWWASMVHRPRYEKDLSTKEYNQTKEDVCEIIRSHFIAYEGPKGCHKEHIDRILLLQRALQSHSGMIDGSITFGIAQKIFNVGLKFLWLSETIEEPIHLPVDRLIVEYSGVKDVAWSKVDHPDKYMEVISGCKRVADRLGLSLAQWELLVWNLAFVEKG
ncbi:hypothetical protein N1030_11135 [Desulfovibrio mangrovi]|uniref:hypothetical protein n=1 Tax=Desulfovibrio mangrovi TaxID=2976983 RepID=UPI0022476B03|nr:hypothetical protein [Desulfovibrio mangrovi]UZP66175.1 hypothetical protein N1030_11135 [Desulfovibrio mangrovi]